LYTSTHVLLLKEHPETVGKFGALVVVPTRQSVLCHPIDDLSALDAARVLTYIAAQWNKKDPGPVTTNLYWYHEGRFTQIPYEIHGDEFQLKPTKEFYAVLNTLPPAPTTRGGD
jgi:hypothetical protein